MCPHCAGDYSKESSIEGLTICGDCGKLSTVDEWITSTYPELDTV